MMHNLKASVDGDDKAQSSPLWTTLLSAMQCVDRESTAGVHSA